jgi:hypothetical protein
MSKTDGQKASQYHERRLADLLDGTIPAASGAFWTRKGDVRTEQFLIEHKYTAKKSFSVTRTVLDKIRNEAIMDNRTPVLALHISGRDYVVLHEDDWLALIGL